MQGHTAGHPSVCPILYKTGANAIRKVDHALVRTGNE